MVGLIYWWMRYAHLLYGEGGDQGEMNHLRDMYEMLILIKLIDYSIERRKRNLIVWRIDFQTL